MSIMKSRVEILMFASPSKDVEWKVIELLEFNGDRPTRLHQQRKKKMQQRNEGDVQAMREGRGGGGEGREGKGGGRDVRHDQADQYLNKIARHSARPPARQSEQQQLLLGQRTTTPSCSTSASSLFIMYLRTVAWCYIRYLCYLPGQLILNTYF